MGRPKKGQSKLPPATDERVAIIHLKGTPEYAAWLDDVYKKTRLPKTTIVRVAIEEWAKRNGHVAPPEM